MISILCTVSGWPNFFHLHSSEGIYSVLLFAFLRFNSCAPFRLKLPCLAIRSLRTSGKLFVIQRRERLENINFPWRRATFEVLSTSRTAASRILWPGESSSGELTGHLGTTSLVTSNLFSAFASSCFINHVINRWNRVQSKPHLHSIFPARFSLISKGWSN